MMMRRFGCGAAVLGLFIYTSAAQAQIGSGPSALETDPVLVCGSCSATLPVLQAIRVHGDAITIDGLMSEAAWSEANVATDWVQFEPNEGAPATEATEARVLYGDDALYVFLRAFDSAADSIASQLTRRDQDSYSDQLGVVIDSYFDRRTAFHFAVNPKGVKHDIYRFDDTNEDSGWDAVWEVGTSTDADGWSAEFRIPYSQLRFRDTAVQTWGINFLRNIARHDETAVWAPVKREDSAIVSKFGELQGLRDLKAPTRMEIAPYSLARLDRSPGDAANPFYSENDRFGTVGADVKYGLTSDLTLDLTLNPDFGQVEADPAQVNLTAFETFLPERRPFFLEGASIFNFGIALGDGDQANESLFYSRRIGRSPQGYAEADGGYTDTDDNTNILGAWKLSGKTADGWSIGVMHALTGQEKARIAPTVGNEYEQAVEPLSNYGVLRVQKDFREGRSAVGVIGTVTNRDGDIADALELRSSAYAGGIDFRHRFGGDYSIDGYVLASQVQGSEAAIARTQRSPLRYYQRPDAGHVEYDPTQTSLSGASAFLTFGKVAGEHWRFSTGLHTRTPGFEVNDIGFQRDADSFINWAWVGYQQTTPQGPFRNWNLNTNVFIAHNYDGDRGGRGGNVNGSVMLKNFWHAYAGVNLDGEGYSGQMLRGGPLFLREGSVNFWSGFGTDSRKAVRFDLNMNGNVRNESDSWNVNVSPSMRFRPSGRATFTVGSFLNKNVNDRQWVSRVDLDDAHYVFGRIEQSTVGLTARVDYAFTPTLSLQVYAQPFVSAGSYNDYKQVADPVADQYADRFALLDAEESGGTVRADLDGDGTRESFGAPDFNFKQFRSNAVLRWEYRPGSALFLVWSQGRNQYVGSGDFDFNSDMRDLFDVEPDNVFMVKLSYWFSR
ncbi:MAG: carbohydrate binding family 9 domain-containing protein [Gemmatimonadales bacterium]|nr:carbohydrate binding family 9 domain-containing protein [Gemmatimonadales bacterium]